MNPQDINGYLVYFKSITQPYVEKCAWAANLLWGNLDQYEPWFSFFIFMGCSTLMVLRLGAMEEKGLEGTVLGTLIMPYASGFPNLVFAFVLGRQGGNGALVIENCLVNNVTNLTLLIGLPALFWKMKVAPSIKEKRRKKKGTQAQRLNYLSLLLTLVALMFFTGALWVMGRDGAIDGTDGIVLIGIFIFWQVFHIFDVLKHNVHKRRRLPGSMVLDIFLIITCGLGIFAGIERVVQWIMQIGPGSVIYDHLGLISGCIMVLPNGFLAFYYAREGRADIVYSSQVGDGHICIPMCIGLFALFTAIAIPDAMNLGILIIVCAGLLHFLFIFIAGRLPRIMGVVLTCAYGYFIYTGFIS